jgi:hypothetical protein
VEYEEGARDRKVGPSLTFVVVDGKIELINEDLLLRCCMLS